MVKGLFSRVIIVSLLMTGFLPLLLPAEEHDIRGEVLLYIEEGKKLFDQNDYFGAIDKWIEALNKDPWNEDAKELIERGLKRVKEITEILHQGFDFLDKGDRERAYGNFLYVKNNMSPKNKDLYPLLVRGFRTLEEMENRERFSMVIEMGDSFLQEGRFEEAKKLYDLAPKYFTDEKLVSQKLTLLERMVQEENLRKRIEGIRSLALELFGEERYEESREMWDELLNLSPLDGEALLHLSIIEDRERERERLLLAGKGYFDSGVSLYGEQRYEEAIEEFEKAIAMDYGAGEAEGYIGEMREILEKRRIEEEAFSRRIEGIRSLALEFFSEDRYEESREMWDELLTFIPGDEEALLYLSKIEFKERERERLLLLARGYFTNGISFYTEKRYKEATDQFENAIAMGYQVQEAIRYMEEIRASIEEHEKLEREKREEEVGKYLREGIKFFNLNRFRESIGALNMGLNLDPDNSQIKEYIMRDIIALKKEEERNVSPTSPFYELYRNLLMLGMENYNNGNYQEAIKHYEQILLIFPYNEEARVNLTRALNKTDPALVQEILASRYSEAKELLKRGNREDALYSFKLISEVDPDFKDVKTIVRELEEEEKALIKRISEGDKKRAEGLYKVGLELFQNEKLEEAIDMAKKTVEIYPDFVEARVFLSKAEAKLRNLQRLNSGVSEEANAVDERLRIKAKKHYLDGINYFMDGMYREAISEWEEALKIEPGNESLKINVDRAKKRLGFEENQKSL